MILLIVFLFHITCLLPTLAFFALILWTVFVSLLTFIFKYVNK